MIIDRQFEIDGLGTVEVEADLVSEDDVDLRSVGLILGDVTVEMAGELRREHRRAIQDAVFESYEPEYEEPTPTYYYTDPVDGREYETL